MVLKQLGWIVLLMALTACDNNEKPVDAAAPIPFVRTVTIKERGDHQLILSATLRARHETPLAFQVGGRIAARRVDAGQAVRKGQTLFELDPRDLDEEVRAARAERDRATSILATAQANLRRDRDLVNRQFVSAQTLERTELSVQEAQSSLAAAESRLQQARNSREYGRLSAPAAGVVLDVSAERGQVVTSGQVIGTLAHEGARELEVFIPDQDEAPRAGALLLPSTGSTPVILREVAGAVDPASRTRRARYRIEGGPAELARLALGTVLRVVLDRTGPEGGAVIEIPIGALDERGQGPRIWLVRDGRVEPLPVQAVELLPEYARIRTDLAPGSRIVALGVHLLQPGMAVRVLEP